MLKCYNGAHLPNRREGAECEIVMLQKLQKRGIAGSLALPCPLRASIAHAYQAAVVL